MLVLPLLGIMYILRYVMHLTTPGSRLSEMAGPLCIPGYFSSNNHSYIQIIKIMSNSLFLCPVTMAGLSYLPTYRGYVYVHVQH